MFRAGVCCCSQPHAWVPAKHAWPAHGRSAQMHLHLYACQSAVLVFARGFPHSSLVAFLRRSTWKWNGRVPSGAAQCTPPSPAPRCCSRPGRQVGKAGLLCVCLLAMQHCWQFPSAHLMLGRVRSHACQQVFPRNTQPSSLCTAQQMPRGCVRSGCGQRTAAQSQQLQSSPPPPVPAALRPQTSASGAALWPACRLVQPCAPHPPACSRVKACRTEVLCA